MSPRRSARGGWARLIAGGLWLTAALGCPSAPDEEAPGPAVVAPVGADRVTTEDLARLLRRHDLGVTETGARSEEELDTLKRSLLEREIERLLMLQEARASGLSVRDEEVEAALAELRADYPGRSFEAHLAEGGIPLSALRSEVAERVLIEALLRREVVGRVAVTDEEIAAWYEAHPDDFARPAEVNARQIVLRSREEAERLRAELRAGRVRFEVAARRHSVAPEGARGGDLGWFSKGVMPPPIDPTCFELRAGRLSEVIESPHGYHLFEVVEKRSSRTLSLEQARDQIVRALRMKKEQEAEVALRKRLFEKTPVQIEAQALSEVR